MAENIATTNPEYIQFKDANGTLHYYQRFPKLTENDVNDYIKTGYLDWTHNVGSNAIKSAGIINRTTTHQCLYIYSTREYQSFTRSGLKGEIQISGNWKPLNLIRQTTHNSDVGLSTYISSFTETIRPLVGGGGTKYTYFDDKWTKPKTLDSISLWTSNETSSTKAYPPSEFDYIISVAKPLIPYGYGCGIVVYSEKERDQVTIKNMVAILMRNPDLVGTRAAELTSTYSGQTLCSFTSSSKEVITQKFQTYSGNQKDLDLWVQKIALRFGAVRHEIVWQDQVDSSGKVIEAKDPEVFHYQYEQFISGTRKTAIVDVYWKGIWAWLSRETNKSNIGGRPLPVVTSYKNTLYIPSFLGMGGINFGNITINNITKYGSNIKFDDEVQAETQFVVSNNSKQYIGEDVASAGEVRLKMCNTTTPFPSRFFYYNLTDPYQAITQS